MYKYFLILFVFAACSNVNELTVYQSEVIPTEGINGFTSTDVFRQVVLTRYGEIKTVKNVII